jgi:hypothetical protein
MMLLALRFNVLPSRRSLPLLDIFHLGVVTHKVRMVCLTHYFYNWDLLYTSKDSRIMQPSPHPYTPLKTGRIVRQNCVLITNRPTNSELNNNLSSYKPAMLEQAMLIQQNLSGHPIFIGIHMPRTLDTPRC